MRKAPNTSGIQIPILSILLYSSIPSTHQRWWAPWGQRHIYIPESWHNYWLLTEWGNTNGSWYVRGGILICWGISISLQSWERSLYVNNTNLTCRKILKWKQFDGAHVSAQGNSLLPPCHHAFWICIFLKWDVFCCFGKRNLENSNTMQAQTLYVGPVANQRVLTKRLGKGKMTCASPWASTKQGDEISECQAGEGSWPPGGRLELSGPRKGHSGFEQKQKCGFINVCSFFVSLALFLPFLGTEPSFTLKDTPSELRGVSEVLAHLRTRSGTHLD